MKPLGHPCPNNCGRQTNADGKPCFFCESADKIGKLQSDTAARGVSFVRNMRSHQTKPVHTNRLLITRGHRGRA